MKGRPAVARSIAVRLSLLLTCLVPALPLSAQVQQPTRPPGVQPKPLPEGPHVTPLPDLRVSKVAIRLVDSPAPMVYADVTIENTGAASAVFPAQSRILYAYAQYQAGLMFTRMDTPVEYTIPRGESRTLILKADPCPPGPAGPAAPRHTVVFEVDPTNKVAEVDESANTASVEVDDYTQGDLTGSAEFVAAGSGGASDAKAAPNSVLAAQAADLVVTIKNAGTGSALICPQRILWMETQSPLQSKYRLRSVTTPTAVVIPPGQKTVSKLANAYSPGDLPPGKYPWAIGVSPNNNREKNQGNNGATLQLEIR